MALRRVAFDIVPPAARASAFPNGLPTTFGIAAANLDAAGLQTAVLNKISSSSSSVTHLLFIVTHDDEFGGDSLEDIGNATIAAGCGTIRVRVVESPAAPSSPDRLCVVDKGNVGFAHFDVHGKSLELLIDTGCSLDLLLHSGDATLLNLVEHNKNRRIQVKGIGGIKEAKYAGEVLVKANLVDKVTKTTKKVLSGTLQCFYFEPDTPFQDCPAPSLDESMAPDDNMDVDSHLTLTMQRVCESQGLPVRVAPVSASSLDFSLLGKIGLRRIGLEMKLQQGYLFEQVVVSALVV